MREVPSWCRACSGRGSCRDLGMLLALLPDGGISLAGRGDGKGGDGLGGAAGSRAGGASVQVAHTKRASSLLWRHMIKIFSLLPLPEAIYCFSAASPLGQRARRCSRPRGDAPASPVRPASVGSVFVPSRAWPSACLGCLGREVFSAFAWEKQHRVEYF